jgi:2-keto-4-pentenoate hydratase
MEAMNRAFDPRPAADLLAEAWRSGVQLSELPAVIRPTTLSQGYDVQDALVALLGERVVGWKLGVGSTRQKKDSGVGRSIAGQVLRSRLHRHGDVVPVPGTGPATLEFEIAYVLGRDIRPDDAAFPVLEAVAEIRPSFELVRSRFLDRRAVGWPSFAADDGAFHALVLGEAVDPARIADLRSTVAVAIDGRAIGNTQGDDRTDPEAALADLVAIARERRMTLPKGSVVSTGTVSVPTVMTPGEAAVTARFLDAELAFRTRIASATPPSGR